MSWLVCCAEATAKRLFKQYANQDLPGYSADELDMIFKHRVRDNRGSVGQADEETSLPDIALCTAIHFSNKVLRLAGSVPRCRIEYVGNWRKAFLNLGQDVFVCGFLAKTDIQKRFHRSDFTWPAVIRTDHSGLNALLDRGLAENHQHLYGSSQSFPLSWCCMMNHPEDHHRIGKEFDEFLQPHMSKRGSINLLSSRKRVEYASFLRSKLFNWLKSLPSEKEFEDGPWDGLDQLDRNLIRNLRQSHGARVPQHMDTVKCLDYALEHDVFLAAPDAAYRALAGERNFLYLCFRKYLDGEMPPKFKMAFYLYLVLKAQFRSELIQVNQHVGFQNFSDYQGRKSELFEHHPCYWAELIRMALNAPFTDGSVTSLETRVIPKTSAVKTCDRILEADTLKQYADTKCLKPKTEFAIQKRCDAESPFFYVFHYTKKKDVDWERRDDMAKICRHEKLRKHIRKQSLAMAQALSTSQWFRQRVRGIDSASNEIGCPPEVFAQAFRFMRHYRDVDFRYGYAHSTKDSSRLGVTYHVGEDFLDIASALRCIDQAVTLLQMQRGDRLGHALGLGVNPEQHYLLKGHRIYLPMQERLDDLVWLLFRSRELDVHMDAHLYGCLKKEAETLLIRIYGDAINYEKWSISLNDYYCAMSLRGDDPACYKEKSFRPRSEMTPYETFAISTHSRELEAYRQYHPYCGLTYYYHYDTISKQRGSQVISCDVSTDYMKLMEETQCKLQAYIEQLGIAIECNPSSNVLIGTFQTYRDHPIFRFHDVGSHMGKDWKAGQNLEVSVNTDDLGVFDTSLEFEYALLFDALSNEKNCNGEKMYTQEQILCYLEQLRSMGFLAVFPSNQVETRK